MKHRVCIKLTIQAVVTVEDDQPTRVRSHATKYLTSEIESVMNGDNDNLSDIEGSVIGEPEILWVSGDEE
jgi:hypothetical protein